MRRNLSAPFIITCFPNNTLFHLFHIISSPLQKIKIPKIQSKQPRPLPCPFNRIPVHPYGPILKNFLIFDLGLLYLSLYYILFHLPKINCPAYSYKLLICGQRPYCIPLNPPYFTPYSPFLKPPKL